MMVAKDYAVAHVGKAENPEAGCLLFYAGPSVGLQTLLTIVPVDGDVVCEYGDPGHPIVYEGRDLKWVRPSDYVVTVPKTLWEDWILEGDCPGDEPTGEEWGFFLGGSPPREPIKDGDRLYVVAHGKLRGYSPITRVATTSRGFAFCRQAGAVAVTIDTPIPGFRGFRRRWWSREAEKPFPGWRVP